ncbi:rRNA maturation RNase YbeY [Muricauda sp. JGD-17]|uniref:Endoribonuclease YbeY n=1 Tax=Flagellimonas ochracea TaxID=2696472 RepID=A0A964WX19_9FLAO|nr:rRNA maturation RNase YbeY [Allomuricauda ochracea]NAY91676.1 rRNA maturation RNase YbeY [Allomuricauda ochracea]
MIEFHYKSDFRIEDKTQYSDWISRILVSEGFHAQQIDFIFCTDEYLIQLNKQYLNHDTYTDIITFDYSTGKSISGDIFISTERIEDNAKEFNVSFENELLRVMAHGLLHLMGHGDKTQGEQRLMRKKEEEKIKMFHVEQ